MTLREQAIAELDQVHFNLDEHAEEITFDGQTVRAIVEERKGEPQGQPGVNITEMEIRVRASEIEQPKPGQTVEINGQKHFVRIVEPSEGELIIHTYRNES